MKRFVNIPALIFILVATGSVAFAQFANPGDAIRYRKAVMRVIGTHFGSMGAVIKGEKPHDSAKFVTDAKVVAMMAQLPWDAFLVPDSFSGDTKTKENVVKEAEKFMASAHTFEKASQGLATMAEGGDLTAVKPLFGETAKTCKGCHGAFRK